MERFAPFILIVGIGLFLVTVAAYYEGMRVWLGWGFFPAFAVMILAFILRDIGALFISIVGFFGMWKGWDWPVWQALLVAFPMLAILVVTMLGGGLAEAFSSTRRRAV